MQMQETLQKGFGLGIDHNNLNEEHTNKLIEIIGADAERIYTFNQTALQNQHLENMTDKANVQKTKDREHQITLIFIFLFATITGLVLIFKEQYITQWFSFIAGLGVSQAFKLSNK